MFDWGHIFSRVKFNFYISLYCGNKSSMLAGIFFVKLGVFSCVRFFVVYFERLAEVVA